MAELTKQQINRQDFVGNQIFELIRKLFPSKHIDWDIEMIEAIRDTIQEKLINKERGVSEKQFYPYIK